MTVRSVLLDEYREYHCSVIINPLEEVMYGVMALPRVRWPAVKRLMGWNWDLHIKYRYWDKDSRSWKRRGRDT